MPFFGKRKNKNVTLQARIPIKIKNRRRVLLSASVWRKHTNGSLTIEAAFCLSLFIFASICLMLPMKMLDTHRKIQIILETTGEDISQLAYIKEIVEAEGKENLGGKEKWEGEYLQYFADKAVTAYLLTRINRQVKPWEIDCISLEETKLLEDGEHIDLVMNYRMRFPFSVLSLEGLTVTSRSRKRAWIGKPGGTGKEDGQEEDITVYVGKGRGRYHWNRDCHYLSNDIRPIAYEEIASVRNNQGGKYYPCKVCGAGASSKSIVYIMPSGSNFHSNKYCSSIVAYVKAVPLSSVKDLGACSYCTRKKEGN